MQQQLLSKDEAAAAAAERGPHRGASSSLPRLQTNNESEAVSSAKTIATKTTTTQTMTTTTSSLQNDDLPGDILIIVLSMFVSAPYMGIPMFSRSSKTSENISPPPKPNGLEGLSDETWERLSCDMADIIHRSTTMRTTKCSSPFSSFCSSFSSWNHHHLHHSRFGFILPSVCLFDFILYCTYQIDKLQGRTMTPAWILMGIVIAGFSVCYYYCWFFYFDGGGEDKYNRKFVDEIALDLQQTIQRYLAEVDTQGYQVEYIVSYSKNDKNPDPVVKAGEEDTSMFRSHLLRFRPHHDHHHSVNKTTPTTTPAPTTILLEEEDEENAAVILTTTTATTTTAAAPKTPMRDNAHKWAKAELGTEFMLLHLHIQLMILVIAKWYAKYNYKN